MHGTMNIKKETAVFGTYFAHAYMFRSNMTKQLAIVVFLMILGDSCYPAFLIV